MARCAHPTTTVAAMQARVDTRAWPRPHSATGRTARPGRDWVPRWKRARANGVLQVRVMAKIFLACIPEACYSDTLTCTSANAAATCGDATFCIDNSSPVTCNAASMGCTCRCTVGATPGAGGVVVNLGPQRGPVCVDGAGCTLAPPTFLVAGYRNCGGV